MRTLSKIIQLIFTVGMLFGVSSCGLENKKVPNKPVPATTAPCSEAPKEIQPLAAHQIFEEILKPSLISRCGSCHGASQTPLFAQNDSAMGWKVAEPLLDRLIFKAGDGHCGVSCQDSQTLNNTIDTLKKKLGEPAPVPKSECTPQSSTSPSPSPSPTASPIAPVTSPGVKDPEDPNRILSLPLTTTYNNTSQSFLLDTQNTSLRLGFDAQRVDATTVTLKNFSLITSLDLVANDLRVEIFNSGTFSAFPNESLSLISKKFVSGTRSQIFSRAAILIPLGDDETLRLSLSITPLNDPIPCGRPAYSNFRDLVLPTLFNSLCLRCHDTQNRYILDLNNVFESARETCRYVIPGDPTGSVLYQRAVDGIQHPAGSVIKLQNQRTTFLNFMNLVSP